ncbi:MAG: methyltransferase domain-containing protein [Chloroflexota bacterium]|jgi:ubiquinone/menaquinone biosynthesis C-methylase UbiE|nr:MAG: methyltransferase domain-containing protein [Chloroflexota bacterium]
MRTSFEELARIRQVYSRRIQATSSHYSLFNQSYLYTWQQRQRATLRLLNDFGIQTLSDKRVLEIGCGSGSVLLEYLNYGITPGQAFGLDLMPQLISGAKQRLPHLCFVCADGQHLPFPARTFDIVLQYTVFSSILDAKVKENVAQEMLRVLSPKGIVLWYDFWWNPINPETRGIHLSEVSALFPNCSLKWRRITLAPPIARRLVRFSWLLCELLEKLRLLNTHYLVAIRPKAQSERPRL